MNLKFNPLETILKEWDDFTCKQILVLNASCPKRGEESRKFPLPGIQLFAILFSYNIFKQFFNISATQNKNCPFLTKDLNILSFHSLFLSG